MVTSLKVVANFLNLCSNKHYLVQFWPNCGLLLQTLRVWWSYNLLDSLKMKAHFNTILPYFSLNITLRRLYCIFRCSRMLCLSIVIQITQFQLSTTSLLWDIQWKPNIDIFPGRPSCIYTIWPAEVKSNSSCTAITHFLTPWTYT